MAPLWCAICLSTTGAGAQEEEIIVIGITPTQSATRAEKEIPYNVQSAFSEDIDRAQSVALSDFLNYNIGSVSVLNVNHREAPSTIAASKGGAGIDRRPANRSNAINGVNIQTSIITTENMAEFAAEAH